MKRRHQPQLDEEDEVIDLRDRLAPYDDVAVLPPSPPEQLEVAALEVAATEQSEVFTGLEFDFEYRMGRS